MPSPSPISPKILIQADDRERSAGTLRALMASEGAEVQIQRLKVGDYLVDGKLVVERKSLNDFLNSLSDGRLFQQASRMAGQNLPSLLILEGRWQEAQNRAFTRQAIQGALISLAIIWGIPVIRSQNPEESAELMLSAAHQLRRSAYPSAFRPGRTAKGMIKAQTYLLQGLPGVGRQLALALLKHFQCPAGVFSASASELRQVHGIGPKKAQKIRAVLDSMAVNLTLPKHHSPDL